MPSAVSFYRLAQGARDKAFSAFVGSSFESFGARSVIQPPLRVYGEEAIRIGSDVFVGASSWFQWIGPPSPEPRIVIGDGTSMSGMVVLSAAERITIGRSVLFARNVYVSDHSHATNDRARPVSAQGIDQIAEVAIGDGAWLGQNVVVLPGVRIGRGAVIGAGSIVRDDIPEYSIAVGAPARVVGQTRKERARDTTPDG